MRTSRHTLIALLLAAATLGLTASAAYAAPISAKLTARDVYWAYTGNADGSNLTLLGGDSGWAVAETYTANVPAGSYLYVVAWTMAGEEDQAFQGSVTTGAGTVYTNGTQWQGWAVDAPFVGFANTTAAVPSASLSAEIAQAAWAAPAAIAPATTWGDKIGGGQANWIWLDSFAPPNGEIGYVIYRTALDAEPQAEVPEPTTPALVLAALAAGTLTRRRRASGRV